MGSRLGAAILASLFAVSLWGCACCDKEHPRGPEFMNPTPVVAVRQIGTLLLNHDMGVNRLM
ncbi:MAG TPA: hypothetical protein PK400_02975, partial [Phycisphaerales bacterium]|nr:hypothetical protein [Phycisphaerales bacterium]